MELGKALGGDLKRHQKTRAQEQPVQSFLSDMKGRRYVSVMRQLSEGFSPNTHYRGVVPLMVAVNSGDIDLVAILMHWRADPDLVLRGTWQPTEQRYVVNEDQASAEGDLLGQSARDMARASAEDPEHRHHGAAALMLELMDAEPPQLVSRLAALQQTLKAEVRPRRPRASAAAALAAATASGGGGGRVWRAQEGGQGGCGGEGGAW